MSGPSGTTRFVHDGIDVIAEYDGSNALQKRYVRGQDTDEIAATYSCSSLGLTCRTYPQYDERGSVISLINADGSLNAINRYDGYGNPQAGSVTGRFGFTGQMWLPEVGAYYYKNRMYSPALGRFMQTDPIGPADDANLYAYVGNDPVNLTDPSGLCRLQNGSSAEPPTGTRICGGGGAGGGGNLGSSLSPGSFLGGGNDGGFFSDGGGYVWEPGSVSGPGDPNITITAGHWSFVPNINFGSDFGLTPNDVDGFDSGDASNVCANGAPCDIRTWKAHPLQVELKPVTPAYDDTYARCVASTLNENNLLSDIKRATIAETWRHQPGPNDIVRNMKGLGGIPLFNIGYALTYCNLK